MHDRRGFPRGGRPTNTDMENAIPFPAIDIRRLEAEIVTRLQDLIRFNTANPPGNELPAALYCAEAFKREGIAAQVIESAPGRASVVARLKGDGSRRPLLLMSHLDVVDVERDKWECDPFGGEIRNGYVWGRGALDCKNTVALWMEIMLALKRAGIVPRRDVIFLAAADEETGGSQGCGFITGQHYDLIDAEAALNEGGGFPLQFMGRTSYCYQAAEKGNLWLALTATGTPGHASLPRADNPVAAIAGLVTRLTRLRHPIRVTPTVRAMVTQLAARQNPLVGMAVRQLANPWLSDALIALAVRDEVNAGGLKAMLHNTISPTILRAGQKINVIPSEAVLQIDYRILPGYDLDAMLDGIRRYVGRRFTVQVLEKKSGTESVHEHPLARSLRTALHKSKPNDGLVPLLIPGMTDAAFLRPRGMVVYGFSPLLPQEDITLAHGHNERVSIASLEFSVRVGLDAVLDFVM